MIDPKPDVILGPEVSSFSLPEGVEPSRCRMARRVYSSSTRLVFQHPDVQTEITPAMIEAGVLALLDCDLVHDPRHQVVREVLRAALTAQLGD